MATEERRQRINRVTGTVTDNNGLPLPGLKVEIHDVDMRAWQLLADTVTDRRGGYEVHWSHDQLSGRGKGTADIAVKVITRGKNTEIFRSSMDQVRFNAGKHEEINITVTQSVPQEQAEYEFLLKKISFLAGKVPLSELSETGEHRDITFLSRELDVPAQKIEHMVVVHRIRELSKIDPEFFYALLRKDTLLHNDFSRSMNARLNIGINDDVTTVLYDAALTDREKIEDDIKSAIEEGIVAPRVEKITGKNIEILYSFRKKAGDYYEKEHTRKTIELLTNALSGEKIEEMRRLYEEHKLDPATFFDRITDVRFSDGGRDGSEKGSREEGDGEKDSRGPRQDGRVRE
jgi:5-hydroxyisourate hydrolase-like protein (transthyretin family)